MRTRWRLARSQWINASLYIPRQTVLSWIPATSVDASVRFSTWGGGGASPTRQRIHACFPCLCPSFLGPRPKRSPMPVRLHLELCSARWLGGGGKLQERLFCSRLKKDNNYNPQKKKKKKPILIEHVPRAKHSLGHITGSADSMQWVCLTNEGRESVLK